MLGDLRIQLDQGLQQQGLPVDGRSAEQLLHFLNLLQKWNRVHNLTAIRDLPSMVTAHLLDSLSALPYITGNSMLDVGSGAGLPGFPLAIVCPTLSVTLLESRKKKTMFLNNVVGSMALGNVEVVCQRVEQYRPPRKFDTLVTRAFSTLATFAESSAHLCAPGGRLIAMKGRFPEAELAEIDQSQFEVTEVCPVSVPGLDAKRHLVVLNPS